MYYTADNSLNTVFVLRSEVIMHFLCRSLRTPLRCHALTSMTCIIYLCCLRLFIWWPLPTLQYLVKLTYSHVSVEPRASKRREGMQLVHDQNSNGRGDLVLKIEQSDHHAKSQPSMQLCLVPRYKLCSYFSSYLTVSSWHSQPQEKFVSKKKFYTPRSSRDRAFTYVQYCSSETTQIENSRSHKLQQRCSLCSLASCQLFYLACNGKCKDAEVSNNCP